MEFSCVPRVRPGSERTPMSQTIRIRNLAVSLAEGRDYETKTKACENLKTICFDESSFQAIRKAEAIPALVGALTQKPPLASMAADAIWSLSEDPANRFAIREAGGVALGAQLMSATESESVVEVLAVTLTNLIDIETGDMRTELLAAGGIDALLKHLPTGEDILKASQTSQTVAFTLAHLAVDPVIADQIRLQGGVALLVEMLSAGARAASARHAAACLARIAHNNSAGHAAIREAGGIELLIDLIQDALDTWALSEDDMQAAQHGAAALWTLAVEPASRAHIMENANGIKLLVSMLGGRAGGKAEGNAAGALLALTSGATADPVSVLAEVGAA